MGGAASLDRRSTVYATSSSSARAKTGRWSLRPNYAKSFAEEKHDLNDTEENEKTHKTQRMHTLIKVNQHQVSKSADLPPQTRRTRLSKPIMSSSRTLTARRLALGIIAKTRETYTMTRRKRQMQINQDAIHDRLLPQREILFRLGLMKVMQYLDYRDLGRAGVVSKRWNIIMQRHLRVSDEGFCEEENAWIRSQLAYNETFFVRSMVQYLCEAVAQVIAHGEEDPSEEALDNMAAKVRQHHSHYATCPAVAMALLNNEPGAHEKAMEHERVFRAKYSRLKVLLSRREFIKRVVFSLIEGMQAGEGVLEAARQRLESAAEEEARLQALQFYGDASSVDERCATTAGIYHGDIIVACRSYFAKIEAATEKEHSRACTEIRNLIHGKMAFPRGDTFKGFELVVPSDNSWESRRGIPAIASMTDAELEDADIEIFFGRNLPQLSVALVKLSMTSRCRERFLSEDYLKTKVLAKLEDLIRTCTPDHNIFHDSYESIMGSSLHPDLPTRGIEALTPVDLAFGMVESRIDEYLDYFIDQRWLERSGATVRESEGLPISPDEVETKEEGWFFDELCCVFFAALEKSPEKAALFANDRSKIHQRALRRYIHHTLTKENARHGLATSSQGCSIAPVTKRIELTHRLVPALTRAALRDLGRSLDGQADDFERRIFDDDNQRLLKVLNALALRELADLLEQKRLEILEYEKQSLKVDL